MNFRITIVTSNYLIKEGSLSDAEKPVHDQTVKGMGTKLF